MEVKTVTTTVSTIDPVAFTAILGDSQHDVRMGQTVVYDRVLTNEGNGYNKATGIFTVPSSGLYFFNITVETKMMNGKKGSAIVHLMVDGKYQIDAVAESFVEEQNMQSSNSAVLKLNTGQRVWIEAYQIEPQFFEGTQEVLGYVFNSFTGYRIA